MKDGSMSYAYHIPGREAVSFQMEEADLWTGSGTKTYDELGTNLLSTGSGIEQDLMPILLILSGGSSTLRDPWSFLRGFVSLIK